MLGMSRIPCKLPMCTPMTHVDAYGAGDDELDELPPLPIPRPGEWSGMASSPSASPLGGPLGGGASFTASGTQAAQPDTERVEGAPIEPIASMEFTWELAARLTSGMLANPARINTSVKEAMGLFDQFLLELNAYARIAAEFDSTAYEVERRRLHEEYFRRSASPGSSSDGTVRDVPTASPAPTSATPKPEPTQPRPMGDYRPIPLGTRRPYTPGSMAGAPPIDHLAEGGEQAA